MALNLCFAAAKQELQGSVGFGYDLDVTPREPLDWLTTSK